jgi:hypothetical protein
LFVSARRRPIGWHRWQVPRRFRRSQRPVTSHACSLRAKRLRTRLAGRHRSSHAGARCCAVHPGQPGELDVVDSLHGRPRWAGPADQLGLEQALTVSSTASKHNPARAIDWLISQRRRGSGRDERVGSGPAGLLHRPLIGQRAASPNTTAAYKVTFRLLLASLPNGPGGRPAPLTSPISTRHSSPPSWTTSRPIGTTARRHATTARPPSTRCSPTSPSTTPKTRRRSSGCSPSRPALLPRAARRQPRPHLRDTLRSPVEVDGRHCPPSHHGSSRSQLPQPSCPPVSVLDGLQTMARPRSHDRGGHPTRDVVADDAFIEHPGNAGPPPHHQASAHSQCAPALGLIKVVRPRFAAGAPP